MNISDKLTKILNSKVAIKTAISNSGGTITDSTPLDEYANSVNSVEENMLRNICNRGFINVVIPDDVTSIGSYAFYACLNLTNITLPQGLTEIKAAALSECRNLNDVNLPSTCTTFGDSCFYNCEKITRMVIPSGTTIIPYQMLYSCNALKTVIFPDTVIEVKNRVLSYCPLELVDFGSGVQTIGTENINNGKQTLYLVKSITPPTLASAPTPTSATTIKIYVPDESVNNYKTATNWLKVADYIYPISEYVEN